MGSTAPAAQSTQITLQSSTRRKLNLQIAKIFITISYFSLNPWTSPHLAGPDLVAAGAEAVDDDLGREGNVEVGGGDGGGVEVVQQLRDLVIASGKLFR